MKVLFSLGWKGALMSYRILLVDDDDLNLQATRFLLERHGYTVHTAQSGAEGVEKVRKNPQEYALVIIDYQMRDMDGAETAERIRRLTSDVYILIYSGDPSRVALQKTWKAGAVEFIEKEGDFEAFLDTVRNWCLKYDHTFRTLSTSAAPTEKEKRIAAMGMVGRSDALAEIARKAMLYRESPQNVLILGETGTGKELVARAVHDESRGPFLAINCAAYQGSTDLLESELFGYEKGAFTGASSDKKGILESANGGTVFFDEIHQLSLTAQAKLLRVFQEKKIRRVGGAKEIDVSFRLVAAAKPDLAARAERGEFLADLFHRLNVLPLQLPALKDRPEDIEPLVAHFTRKVNEANGDRKTFLMRTVRQMESYAWPGNVRELEHTVYRLLTEATDDKITPEQLDGKFFSAAVSPATYSLNDLKQKHEQEEKRHIESVVQASKNKFQAAQRLGVSPSTLHSIMKRFGLYRAEP
jgi:DNA-binding NtrC family response regulator